MGIDIESYRCRVGMFVPHHGTGVMCMSFSFDFSVMMKFIGTVNFVRLLLIMAGIEQNPGPADKFIFRYQYLLIQLGTDVLRKLFNVVVGNNVAKYVTAKSQDIQRLINARVITADQKQFLPPVDNQPDSTNFDISLLSCLLRNICGLRQPMDPVWINPASTDISIEADITRLRLCRNQLMHSDKLVLPEPELISKWQDLSVILLRLNNKGGTAQLQSYINNAETMEIDELLREKLNQTLKAWHESEKRIDEVMSEVTNVKHDLVGVKRKLEAVEQTQQGNKHQHVVKHTDIQKDLIELYKCRCTTLPVSPLFENKEEYILKIYKHPTMNSVKGTKQIKQITCYKDIFCKDNKSFTQIYITGDAGMGKTSFCTFMCLLWSVGKSEDKLDEEQKELQTDVDYMSKFDFVFYISLPDTEHFHVIDMIKEQYLQYYDPLIIQDILRTKHCLILMDGLDEWTPRKDGKKKYKIPERIYSGNCIYLTTSRPYRIESVRLSHRDAYHYIHTTGLHEHASESYVKDVINYMNKENCADRDSSDFFQDINKCGLDDQLCIPMLASHLVVLWFQKTLTDMPRALIYANNLEMLFQRAKKRKVEFPPYAVCTLRLPDSLSELEYLNKFVSLLYNVCHLAFRSLFKHDENVPSLVFTRQQLQAQPYCFSIEETDFLCKIGILSKNEVFGCYSVEKLKISFIHNSYIEFFASLFTSSFDTNNMYYDSMKRWTTLNDVLQFENFFLLLAGFSYTKVKSSIENIYLNLSDDLTACRRKSIFHSDSVSFFCNPYREQIRSLQNIVTSCYKEVGRCNYKNIVLKLEDFIFADSSVDEKSKHIVLWNKTSLKSIHSVEGKYCAELDQIENLQCLHVGKVISGDYVKFTECMLHNQSTINTVCIHGSGSILFVSLTPPLIPELPLRSLQHLTSLSLSHVKIQHNSLLLLVKFLSDNVLIENIKLVSVFCDNHPRYRRSDCTLTLDVPHHTKLTSLCLSYVNILCNNVNTSRLKSIALCTSSKRIGSCYIDVFNCIKGSQIENLDINGSLMSMLDYNTTKSLTYTVKTLSCIKSLKLLFMKLPDDVLLQLHPDVTQVKIVLDVVTMSRQCFHCFIESLVNNKSVIKVELIGCKITSVDGETHSVMLENESVSYMSEHLTSKHTVNITDKDERVLYFETKCCP